MPEAAATRTMPSASAVRAMYEAYPYPSPIVGDSLIEDVANGLYSLYGERSLSGWRILDAGCGTGHRLLAVARRYPHAEFVGVDMTSASLDVASRLAQRHGIRNVRFTQGDLLNLDLAAHFDLVISTGVIVCLEDPQRGLQNLAAALKPDGLLMIWLYHAIGEHNRMMQRELLHLMWHPDSGLDCGVEMMRDLSLQLEVEQYGSSAAQQGGEVSQLNIDVDAYIHPIVNVYRFAESFDLLRNCPGLTWAAVNSINLPGQSRLVDLEEAEHPQMRYFCQTVETLFDKDILRQRFRELPKLQKLQVMEIRLKPTGFTVIAGRDRSYTGLGPRIAGNALELRHAVG